jgi:hypothetical protein
MSADGENVHGRPLTVDAEIGWPLSDWPPMMGTDHRDPDKAEEP